MHNRIILTCMLSALIACSDKSTSSNRDSAPPEHSDTAASTIPTTESINEAIVEANYCQTDDECEFVHSCWCGAVANAAEVPALQDMISEWLQDPLNAEDCASIDCMGFSHIVCEENTCIPIENE
jgi:hypothetical protein